MHQCVRVCTLGGVSDLLLTSPAGVHHALDLVFSGPLQDSEAPGPQLHRTAMGKASRHVLIPQGTLPWASSSRPVPTVLHVPGLKTMARNGGPQFACVTAAHCPPLSARIAVENWRMFPA